MSAEKAIAAALEPLVDSIIVVEKRVDQLQKDFAAPVKYEIDLDDIAADLMLRADLVQVMKGAPGTDGIQGDPGAPGAPGTPGKDGRDGVGVNVEFWKPGIYRKDSIIQHDLGRISIAKCDTNQEPDGEDWQRIGSFGFRWCGLKKEGRDYVDGDLFVENGVSFLWANGKGNMLAKRGRDGTNGRDGKDGADAPVLIDAHFLDECKTLALVMDNGRIVECDMPPMLHEAVTEYPQLKALRDEVAELREMVKALQVTKGGRDGK